MPMARKRILLTGASSGIGRACCELLAADGDEVVGLDIQTAPPQAAQHVQCDLSEPDSIDAALRQIDGRFDALLNVAAAQQPQDAGTVMSRAIPPVPRTGSFMARSAGRHPAGGRRT